MGNIESYFDSEEFRSSRSITLSTLEKNESDNPAHHFTLTETNSEPNTLDLRSRALKWKNPKKPLDENPKTRHHLIVYSSPPPSSEYFSSVIPVGTSSIGIQEVPIEDFKNFQAARFYGLGIDKQFRGRGFFDKIMQARMKYAYDHNVDIVWATVRKHLWGLYSDRGFVPHNKPFRSENSGKLVDVFYKFLDDSDHVSMM